MENIGTVRSAGGVFCLIRKHVHNKCHSTVLAGFLASKAGLRNRNYEISPLKPYVVYFHCFSTDFGERKTGNYCFL